MIAWLYRLFRRTKTLSNILVGFETLQSELEDFSERTTVEMADTMSTIVALQAQYNAQQEEMQRARLVKDNITMVLTQHLNAAPAE